MPAVDHSRYSYVNNSRYRYVNNSRYRYRYGRDEQVEQGLTPIKNLRYTVGPMRSGRGIDPSLWFDLPL